jgi:hypothetical protein
VGLFIEKLIISGTIHTQDQECLGQIMPEISHLWDYSCRRPVSLPWGCFQGIKCMMKLTTHGLFLTCAQKFYLHIYTTCNWLFCTEPLALKGKKKTPLTWKTDVLFMVANPHPLCSLALCQLPSHYFPNSPHPSDPLGPCYITTTTSTILVFLVRNKTNFTSGLIHTKDRSFLRLFVQMVYHFWKLVM